MAGYSDKAVERRLEQRLLKYQQGTAKGFQMAIRNATAFVYRESQKLVPVDTSALRRSGHVDYTGTGFETEAVVVYDTPYAIYVHEDLSKWHAPPTSAKFIERPIREQRNEIQQVIRKAFKRHNK
jgi:hypothetical protein